MAGLLDTIKDKAKQVYQQGLLNQVITNPASVGQELSQLFDPSYMSQVNPMSQETAFDVAMSAPIGLLTTKNLPDILNKYKQSNVILDVMESPAKKELYLSRIEVPKSQRNSGVGSSVMNDLINYADKSNQRITLSPSTDFGATSVNRLKDFYKKFNFVENKGKNKDFTTRELMYRLPKEN
jgi:hypothetical protein